MFYSALFCKTINCIVRILHTRSVQHVSQKNRKQPNRQKTECVCGIETVCVRDYVCVCLCVIVCVCVCFLCEGVVEKEFLFCSLATVVTPVFVDLIAKSFNYKIVFIINEFKHVFSSFFLLLFSYCIVVYLLSTSHSRCYCLRK